MYLYEDSCNVLLLFLTIVSVIIIYLSSGLSVRRIHLTTWEDIEHEGTLTYSMLALLTTLRRSCRKYAAMDTLPMVHLREFKTVTILFVNPKFSFEEVYFPRYHSHSEVSEAWSPQLSGL